MLAAREMKPTGPLIFVAILTMMWDQPLAQTLSEEKEYAYLKPSKELSPDHFKKINIDSSQIEFRSIKPTIHRVKNPLVFDDVLAPQKIE